LLSELNLSKENQEKLFYRNARRILGLRDPAPAKARPAAEPVA
jgi:hypothetical protein